MKKSLLFLALCVTFWASAQTPESKIQTYLDENVSNFGLSQQDVRGWMIESTANSTATGIDNYYLKQRHSGIEIFGAVTNVWVKNGKVINAENRFVPMAAQKVNTTTPQLSVLQGLTKAFQHAGVPIPDFAILNHENKNYTISNGELDEDPVMAELMFQPVGNTLRLLGLYFLRARTPPFVEYARRRSYR